MRLPYTSANTLELFLPRGLAAVVDLLMLLSRAVFHMSPDGGLTCVSVKESHGRDLMKGFIVLIKRYFWFC